MPQLPPWEGMHPLVVHVPIGIYFGAVFLAIAALLFRKHAGTWMWACVLMLGIATMGAFLAVMTGEAAEEIVEPISPLIDDLIHEHEEAGELARNLFMLTFGVGVVLAWFASREQRRPKVIITLAAVFALCWSAGAIQLANTGHQGGMLVHEHGILAPTGVSGNASHADRQGASGTQSKEEEEEDDD